MRKCNEHRIIKHTYVASEHIKCISYNQLCELVKRLEKKEEDIEGKVVDSVYKTATISKQFNATIQKAAELNSNLSSLDNLVTIFENK